MPPEPPDSNSWAAIIREFFDGVPKLTSGLKDIILALGVLYSAWATSNNSGKLDAVGAKADIAAVASTAAATEAAIAKKTTADTAQDAAISAAINTGYEARRTGDPIDQAKAERAEAKVLALPAGK